MIELLRKTYVSFCVYLKDKGGVTFIFNRAYLKC